MSNTLKVKRGTNLSNAGTPAAGELLYKSDTNQLFVGDGSTAATGLSPIGGSASGDIEGVTAGNGLTGGGTTGTVTLNHEDTSSQASVNNSGRTYIQDITLDTYGHITAISSATETVTDTNTEYSAGTGLDLSGTTFSVDVSDFMTNGSNNRVLTATGTDGINAESSLTFSGTQLTNTGDIKIASGSLGVNTNAPSGDGRIRATSYITAGYGTGGVALTHNDGYGNANVTFNHEAGTPEQNGQSARIEVNTDATSSEALMSFETSSSDVTSGSTQGLTESFKIAHDYIEMPKMLRHMGDTDTYIQYDANRIYLVAGGTIKYDSNNGNVIATGDILDQDDMSSNSATAVASQQSIKAYVDAEVAGVVNSAPAALNTLDELAAALGDDANFATTTSTALGNRLRVDTASQGLTGTQQANAITNLGITATKAELNYVDGVTSNIQTQLNGKLSTSGTAANSTLLNNLGSGSFLRSDAVDTASGKITFTNGMQDNVSNVGSVGGTGLEGNQLSTTDWANLPVGFGGMMRSGNQSYGNPGSNYFLFHKIANRDSGGGWGGIAVGYNSNADFYVGHTTVSGSYATWSKIWNEANDGSGSGLDADLLDGSHASAFATLSGNQTFSGAKTFTGRLTISDSGADGLHLNQDTTTNTNSNRLFFTGSSAASAIFQSGNVLSFRSGATAGSSSGTERMHIDTSGIDVTGSITVSGTVDGRDVASDGSKLDGIESGATADQTITLTGDVTGSGTGSFATTVVDDSHNHSWINSNTGDPGDSRLQWWQAANNTTLNPNSNWFTAIRMGHGDPVTYYSNTIAVQMTGTGTGDLYTRNIASGTAGSWFKHWHDGNDGSGSGLDADLLDGIQASGFTRAGVESGTPNTPANKTTFTCNDAIETSSGNQSGLQVWQDTAGADAFMTFHVAGDYAGYFGLDGSTNDLSWGGWSNGNGNKYRVFHAGNSTNITSVGTINTGTWNGSVIASAYLDADTAHLSGTQTFSGAKTFGTQTWNGHITWNNGKNIYVGGESSFDVSGSGVWQVWDSGTGAPFIMCDVGQQTEIGQAGSRGLKVHGTLNATADVVAYTSSDKKLKDNIKNITNPLEKLEKLNGVEFDWNDKQDLYKGHDIGVIAQQVEEVLPEIVDTREDGHKAVKYDRMVALLIEAVKEQQVQINELKEKLNG